MTNRGSPCLHDLIERSHAWCDLLVYSVHQSVNVIRFVDDATFSRLNTRSCAVSGTPAARAASKAASNAAAAKATANRQRHIRGRTMVRSTLLQGTRFRNQKVLKHHGKIPLFTTFPIAKWYPNEPFSTFIIFIFHVHSNCIHLRS